MWSGVPDVSRAGCGSKLLIGWIYVCKKESHFSTLGTMETGRSTTVDIRHTLTQFGDWSRPSRPLSSHLRTGHCGLSAHLKRIGISDTSLCECGQADQTPDHVLQSCLKYAERRQLTWPQGANLTTKLWGSAEDLYRTVGFVVSTGLKIWPARLSIAEEEEEEEEDKKVWINSALPRTAYQRLAKKVRCVQYLYRCGPFISWLLRFVHTKCHAAWRAACDIK